MDEEYDVIVLGTGLKVGILRNKPRGNSKNRDAAISELLTEFPLDDSFIFSGASLWSDEIINIPTPRVNQVHTPFVPPIYIVHDFPLY